MVISLRTGVITMKKAFLPKTVLLLLAISVAGLAEDPKTEEKRIKVGDRDPEFIRAVNACVQKGVEFIRSKQSKNGSFDMTYVGLSGGETALVLLALLKSGVPGTDPAIQKGFTYLRKQPIQHTYAAGLALMAVEALWSEHDVARSVQGLTAPAGGVRPEVPPADLAWMRTLVRFLLSTRISSVSERDWWGYPSGRGDHSNTQIAVLGLRSAQSCGVVPKNGWKKVWGKVLIHFLKTQQKSGPKVKRVVLEEEAGTGYGRFRTVPGVEDEARGWNYQCFGTRASPAMTCAGIASLIISLEGLKRTPGVKVEAAWEAGVKKGVFDGFARLATFLDGGAFGFRGKPFPTAKEEGEGGGEGAGKKQPTWPLFFRHYGLYSVERACVLACVANIARHDWYREGASHLMDSQEADGSWNKGGAVLTQTAFALLFLTKATTPSPVNFGTPRQKTTYLSWPVCPWHAWWLANQWRIFPVAPRLQVVTGTGSEKSQAVDLVIAFLHEALKSGEPCIQREAAFALGRAGNPAAAEALVSLLGSDREAVREAAVLGLGMVQAKSSRLADLLTDANESQRLRVHAAVALGMLGDRRAGTALMRALETEVTETSGMTMEIRAASAFALGSMKWKEAVRPLIPLATSPDVDARLRATAVTALGKFLSKTSEADTEEESLAKRIRNALKTHHPPAVRRAAVTSLPWLGPKACGKSLLDLPLTDADTQVKHRSLIILAERITDERTKKRFQRRVRFLLKKFTHEETLLGFAAIAAGLSGDNAARTALRNLFFRGKCASTRAAAAVGLGFLKDVKAVPHLLKGVRQTDSAFLKTFCGVAFVLMGKKDPKMTEALREIVLDPKTMWSVRSTAATVLAKMGDASTVKTLLKDLEDDPADVRQRVAVSGCFRDFSTVVSLKKLYGASGTGPGTQAVIVATLGHIIDRGNPKVQRLACEYPDAMLPFPNLASIVKRLVIR
jgi:HEAT repeat protein